MSPRRGARPPRRWCAAVATLCVVAVGLLTSASQAQPAASAPARASTPLMPPASDAGLESQFVGRINSLRSSQGLNQLSPSGELVGVARRWTDRMVAAGQISHNPDLGSQLSGSWTKLGENVGVGYDVDGLMQAFINSPSHYANLLEPAWTHLGVGVAIGGDGRIYTTHNFMALSGAAPPASPPTTAPPAPTTVPPTTIITTITTPPPPPLPEPRPTPARVTAVLDPLRSLEAA